MHGRTQKQLPTKRLQRINEKKTNNNFIHKERVVL